MQTLGTVCKVTAELHARSWNRSSILHSVSGHMAPGLIIPISCCKSNSRRPMSIKIFFKLIFKKNAPLIGQFFLKNDETMDEDQVELTGLAV